MTKSKKKMNKQSLIIVVMAILMVGMLAFGGTYAYFTASATTTSGTITTGYVKLSISGSTITFTESNVLPGDEIAVTGYTLTSDVKDASVKESQTTSTYGAYIAVKVTLTGASGTGLSGKESNYLTITAADGWVLDSANGLYVYGSSSDGAVTPGAYTGATAFSPISKIVFSATDNWTQGNSGNTSDNNLMAVTITVTIEAHSLQAKNVTSSNALTELAKLFTTTG